MPEPDDDRSQDQDLPSAPSIGAHTTIDHVPPEERLAGHDHSTVDAMGLEKRRGVIGESFGPSRQRVILTFVIFFAVVAAIFVGLLFLVDQLDQPPDSNPDAAPWSAPDAQQEPATPLQ